MKVIGIISAGRNVTHIWDDGEGRGGYGASTVDWNGKWGL